jgi:hypothetical protein
MERFKLPIALLAVGGATFIIAGDSFLVIMVQTIVLLVVMIREQFRKPSPPPWDMSWRDEP